MYVQMKKVGLYLRVSTDEQAREGISLSSQEQKLRAYCESNGWEIYDIYIDEGKSGAIMDRPELQRLLNDCREGKVDAILVYRLDRFSRSLRNLIFMVEELKNYNVDFVSLTEQLDTTTPTGKLMFHIVGAFAEFERDIIRERIKTCMATKAKSGYAQYKPPFGYRFINKKLVVNEDEAEIIRDVFSAYLKGFSTAAISRQFNIPRSLVYRILTNETYLGRIKWNNEIYNGIHEPIIDEQTFKKVSILLKERKKGRKKDGEGAI